MIKANNYLKRKIIEIIYTAKIYDYNEEKRCCEINTVIHQVINENCYLRKVNKLYPSFNKGKGGDVGEKEGEETKIIKDNKEKSENKKEEGKGKHKRQKTKFKFNDHDHDNNDPTNANANSNSSIKDGGDSLLSSNDVFKESIMEINKHSKTMKRSTGGSNSNNEDNNKKEFSPISSIPIVTIKQPLCYITPTSKDNKKLIEFTQ